MAAGSSPNARGLLTKKPGSPEYPLLTIATEALLFDATGTDLVVAAVPDTLTFRRIAELWRKRPRLRASGIEIALVSRSGQRLRAVGLAQPRRGGSRVSGVIARLAERQEGKRHFDMLRAMGVLVVR